VATDQAARAARCALAIRELLPHEPVVLVAGRGVVTSRLPIGDVIDRGVRILEGEERPETPGVRIDEVIGSLLDERFSIVKEGEARYLVGVGGGGQVADTLLGKRVPCVGRKRELGALLALLEESAEEPVARAVLVTAPAGGGKSRLASEFLMALGRLEEPPLILFGRGDPMREGSPFSAMARAIRFEAGIVEGEPVALQHRKLELRLESSLEESELPGVSRFLAELIRAPYDDDSDELLAARQDPRLMADAIHDALERWLRAECALRPVLLVFDDMSWGDRPTMEALDELLRRLEQAPLMVLALARPDLHDRFGQLWRDRDVQELRLARLTRGACARLVRAVLGELPEPTLERMIERSEGNPFYLEELIRAVAQDGEADLPESVLAMVEARLDALNPEGRRVLRACSVFGQSCWTEGVERLLGDNHSVREWIEGLSAEELLVRVEAQALAEKEEWRFRSEVVREAAYATLTEEDRRLGHRLAGEWLEAAGSADAVMLAEHFDRGGAGSKAATHYLRAAEHALEANDYGAAGQRAERGVEAGASPLTLGGLRLVQAEGHRWTGDYEGAASFAEQAVQLLPEGSARWYQALGNLLLSAGHRGDVQEMRRWTERALRSEPLEGARVAKVICLCRGSHQELGAGNLAEADTLVEAVQREVGALGVADPVASAWLHTTRASCSLRAGGLGAYIEGTAAAARAYELAGDLRHACNQRVRLGYGYAEVGDYARAERELRAALGQAQRLGLVLVQGYALQNLGSVLANQARFEEAREVEAQALAIAQRVDDAPLEGGCHFYLSVIAERQGDPETAE
ncbi:MAG: AAA family ATPase, partial [Myxococcales bacterium]|nr:AAA family ATPase [Myxococcales bacterium]